MGLVPARGVTTQVGSGWHDDVERATVPREWQVWHTDRERGRRRAVQDTAQLWWNGVLAISELDDGANTEEIDRRGSVEPRRDSMVGRLPSGMQGLPHALPREAWGRASAQVFAARNGANVGTVVMGMSSVVRCKIRNVRQT